MKHTNFSTWWGAPRKFSAQLAERKISWLELFYDLVYVVAISKITQYFSEHPTFSGFLDYVYLFIMIFWGWFNGSLYHDLHGTPGIRTRLMTLWQMVAVAAMIVCLGSPEDRIMVRGTIAIMVMQLYITYLWWSVGIYDKEHRRLNRPYTACYLLSLGALGSALIVPQQYSRIAFFTSLFLNFLPPFYAALLLKNRNFRLSASMTERLGLFTIILFGEVVTGVINGATAIPEFSWLSWTNFVLAILVIFAMWWIFFALIADRACKEGFLKGQLMIMAYIPVLMSLGMLGAGFSGIFSSGAGPAVWNYELFTFRIAAFLLGTTLISGFLAYPDSYLRYKRRVQLLLIVTAALIAASPLLLQIISLSGLFLTILVMLVTIIVIITRIWLKDEAQNELKEL